MVDLLSPEYPELLVTSPRIRFTGGRADVDEETAARVLPHLTGLGVILGPAAPAEQAEQAGPGSKPATAKGKGKAGG